MTSEIDHNLLMSHDNDFKYTIQDDINFLTL